MEKHFREDYDSRLKFAVLKDRAELDATKDSMKVLESRLMQVEAALGKSEKEKAQVFPGRPPADEKQ